jgi:glycogen debranching enzyme
MTYQGNATIDTRSPHPRQTVTALQEGGPHHILAPASLADELTRVLKHADTFVIFDHYGDIKSGGLGEEGLFHEGTRYLSRLVLDYEGRRPFFLGSTVREENDLLTVTLTNPDMLRDGKVWAPLGTLHIALKKFLWQSVLYQEMRVKNHGLDRIDAAITLHFAADYADIFEIRGMQRPARGIDLAPEVTTNQVVLGYEGLDGVSRCTVIQFSPAPSQLNAGTALLNLSLEPQEETTIHMVVGCEREGAAPTLVQFHDARHEAESALERYKAWSCHLDTSSEQINGWINRAASDLHMMTTERSTGPYPYAGVPWFNTPFGRDGIITALECLWIRPELGRGVLAYLASTQAMDVVPEQDAEPGKILHETRNGEMAALKEMPFGEYYGSADATPLFVVLAGAYYERTGDRQFIESIWPNIEAALSWIESYGDRDGDGFVEYQRGSADGLLHQGWRDSDDAVFHTDGRLAEGPIAPCEVQGYVYAAWRAAAALAEMLGDKHRASLWSGNADVLWQTFDEAFWCDDLATFALALDGQKRPCRVRTSSAGHCLYSGIAHPKRVRTLARTLLSRESFSGWGIRSVSSSESRYNPTAYHNGSVWPHDNALIAWGLAQHGLGELALQIWNGMFAAGLHFDLNRMPELFCGFPREPGEGPVLYPVACAPQAWAASVFLLLRACLGLEISAPQGHIHFHRPRLPATLQELRIHHLQVAGTTVDLLLVRHEEGIGVNVLRRDGDVRITVEQ